MSKVLYEVRDDIAYITLNRPEVHNAIDGETDELLFQAWSTFATNPAARLAILTGAGDTTFCAGADLKSHVEPWLSAGPELGRSLLDKGFAGRITRGLHRTPKPIIAALNGWVIGGGIELALACDIRIASERANFGFFHMRRGMHFADGGIVRLVNTCGVGIAMELELMGEPIDAHRAKEVHLVNRVVPHDQVMSTAEAIAAKDTAQPPNRRRIREIDDPGSHRAPARRPITTGMPVRLLDDGQPRNRGAQAGILRQARRGPGHHAPDRVLTTQPQRRKPAARGPSLRSMNRREGRRPTSPHWAFTPNAGAITPRHGDAPQSVPTET